MCQSSYSSEEFPVDVGEAVKVHDGRVLGDGDEEHLYLTLRATVYGGQVYV